MQIGKVQSLDVAGRLSPVESDRATALLEAGNVLIFPELAFDVAAQSLRTLSAATATAKNVSFDVSSGRLKGLERNDPAYTLLREALSDFADFSRAVVLQLFPHYRRDLVIGRTSFRPAEIAGRRTSWRKDDTRLHVDSFPSTPVHGRRILRFFANVNPDGKERAWRIGEPFPKTVPRFLSRLRPPLPGAAAVLAALGATKSRRSRYDHYMLQLHDAMKRDADYQNATAQAEFRFPAGCTWLVYTDLVPHAAMSGQHAFEQTFYLPVEAMDDPSKSPQRVLESMMGRSLV